MIDRTDYPSPVSELIDHGPVKTSATDEWFDYVGHYNLGEIDVPVLIDLAREGNADFSNPSERSAPVHACRALGQLGDSAADKALVQLLDDDENDWLIESAQVALGMLGPRSLAVLKQYFDDPETSIGSQLRALEGISTIAQQHPQLRNECVQILTQTLSNCDQHEPDVNGFLIYYLVEMKATESAQVIEKAWHSGHVNQEINESWEAVQAELGID